MYAAANDPNLTKHKGFIYSLVQGGWPIGALVAAALTALLLPIIGWQGCFIFAAVPALVVAFFARTNSVPMPRYGQLFFLPVFTSLLVRQ
jgi:MFS family permease